MNIEATIGRIISDQSLHPKWLNSLSYLEYRGARKIMRSQKTRNLNTDILLHTLEETRHAFFFKRLAIKLGGASFDSYNANTLLESDDLKKYFFDLDQKITEMFPCNPDDQSDQNISYVLVSWLIEERAMTIYEIYERLLKLNSFDFSVDVVIKDEKIHLTEMRERSIKIVAKFHPLLEDLKKIEELCFGTMWAGIRKAIDLPTGENFL